VAFTSGAAQSPFAAQDARIIFLSLSIARASASIFLFSPPRTLVSRYALEGTHAQFCLDVFAGRPANGFRDTIEGSPAGSYLYSACNDSFYPRMHCPHKSVNQTSLTRCYWCLAATGAAVLASCKQAPLFSNSAQQRADESRQLKETRRLHPRARARFHHFESGASTRSLAASNLREVR